MRVFRWGILGTGNIARSMADALRLVQGADLYAVASRTQVAADQFAEIQGFKNAYGAYETLLADPNVDIVYIATPNGLHKSNILDALHAGKHVLCEKPLTTCPADTKECIEEARNRGLFLMEAMWTAFFPIVEKARALIEAGTIGTPVHLNANFITFRDATDHPNLFDPSLGGGASLDLGIYPLAVAQLLMGPISSLKSEILVKDRGVDEMVVTSALHANGGVSQLGWGFSVDMPISLKVTGSEGVLEIPQNFHQPQSMILKMGSKQQRFDFPSIGMGYAHEVLHVQEMIAQGATESPIWTHNLCLTSAEQIHAIVQNTL